MTPFLRQVADHYFLQEKLEHILFVFPNRRSMAFFKKYLAEAVADPAKNAAAPGHGGTVRPVVQPAMLTISDFFSRSCGQGTADRVSLLLELYESYVSLNPQAEPLDDFIFWGDVLLADFGDVDKYLVDARMIFANISELRDMQGGLDYLTKDQQAAILSLVSHFREGGILQVDPEDSNVKARFLKMWDLLFPLYFRFRKRLEEKGMAYEGMINRALAERMRTESAADVLAERFPGVEKVVFVGLNALNACEHAVLGKICQAGLGECCWDYSSPMIRDPRNRSSQLMEKNLRDFPQPFPLDPGGLPQTRFRVINVPSAVGQVKQLDGIFREIAREETAGILSKVGRLDGQGADCAVVLPDESLLSPLLNSIPEEIASINVTMGYPLSDSAFCGMMAEIAALQMNMRPRDGKWYFYHKNVWALVSGPVFRASLDEEATRLLSALRQESGYYIEAGRFAGHPLLEQVFRPVVLDRGDASASQTDRFGEYLADLVTCLARPISDNPDLAPQLEFAYRYLRCVSSLRQQTLPVLPATYLRLLKQILLGESVPYEGEPLSGLQIMGPLETRALDFDNLVILSCNEGTFPGRNRAPSFIPPEVRRGFSLPTYDVQDAVWAYYFYRMIQRASRVWLICDSRTEKMRPGEESRYIGQLEYHFRIPLERFVAGTRPGKPVVPGDIQKDTDFARKLEEVTLSATALQNYLYCPAKFYYHSICRLRTEDEVAESLDAGMLGNVFHAAMQALYLGGPALDPGFDMSRKSVAEAIRSGRLVPLQEITSAYLQSLLGKKEMIKARVRSLIMAELRTVEVTGRNLVIENVICQYVLKTLQSDLQLMASRQTDRFRVLGLELKCLWEHEGFRFVGYIDRLDSFAPGEVRVVDYKTGQVKDGDTNIRDDNAESIVQQLFGEKNDKRPKIALQLFLYDMFVREMSVCRDQSVLNVVYPAGRLFTSGLQEVPLSEVFCTRMKEELSRLLRELADPEIPFRRTEDLHTCSYCDFKNICGR